MKTKEELEIKKEEYAALNKKLAKLSEDELKQVSGGFLGFIMPYVKPEEPTIEALPHVEDLTDQL